MIRVLYVFFMNNALRWPTDTPRLYVRMIEDSDRPHTVNNMKREVKILEIYRS